jgi:lipid-A-disaccharide synthase
LDYSASSATASKEPRIASPAFFLSAAEHSGDALGAALIEALKRRYPDARFVGVGGPRMAAAGCQLLANPVGRSAMLIGALFSESRYWMKLLKLIRSELASLKPAVVIPIDSSTANLRVAAVAKGQGIPVCYYVAPQLWASRPWRMAKLKVRVDTLCCVLPFEEAYFRRHGVNAVYVGHPMFDVPADGPETDPGGIDPPLPGLPSPAELGTLRAAGDPWQAIRAFKPHGADPQAAPPRIAIFPGSRRAEIDANLPPMLSILSEIKGHYPRVSFVAVAPSEERAWQIRKYLRHGNTPVDIRVGLTDAVIRWADLVLVKSGTATLQVARQHKPMIVLYAAAAWKWHLFARHIINTKYIALVNILADRELVAEYIPFYGSPLPVAREALELLERPELRRILSQELAQLVAPLAPHVGPDGQVLKAAERVALEVVRLAERPAAKPAVPR